VLRLFAVAGPPVAPDRKAEEPVPLVGRPVPAGVHRPVRGGGGLSDPGSTVVGGGGMTEADSAVLGGGGIAEQDESVVLGGGGITDPDSAVLGGGGIAEHDESVVQGGGGITGPPSPKSRWDVSQVQLTGELSNSRSGGEWALKSADQAALAPISILPIVRLARRFRNRPSGKIKTSSAVFGQPGGPQHDPRPVPAEQVPGELKRLT
jgi:hypothetical protein